MSKSPAEARAFQLDAKILYDTIFRQAGTLSKAILETVMNSVDAQATKCVIALHPDKVSIVDDGVGFQSREEVEKNFEIFGRPHEDSERKVYGRFRMGRGQALGYGVNTWTTNTFKMVADVKHKGLNYELSVMKKAVPGCQIEIALYDPISHMGLNSVKEDLEDWCRWVPIPVILNGRQLSTNPADADHWTDETDDAWLCLNDRSELKIYNQGIHVQTYHRSKYGVGGDVVTKRALDVNFARNEIMSTCPVWQRLRPLVDRRGAERAEKSKTLDEADRQALLRRLRNDDLTGELLASAPFITAVTGRNFSIPNVGDGRYGFRVSFAPHGSPIGDRLHRSQSAFIISEKVLTDGRFSAEEFVAQLNKVWDPKRTLVPFAELTEGLDTTYQIIPEAQYRPREKYWMALLETGAQYLAQGVARNHAKLDNTAKDGYRRYVEVASRTRSLLLGEGPADGWTDGRSYIAVSRAFMASQPLDLKGFTAMGLLLAHEYCHLLPDTGAHDHDQAFYESFHDLCTDALAACIDRLLQQAPIIAERVGRKLAKAEIYQQSQLQRSRDSTSKFVKQVNARQG